MRSDLIRFRPWYRRMSTHRPSLTPAEQVLRAAAGPAYFDADLIEPPPSSIAAVDPDDWRLYHLMRNLPEADRARVLEFAELLYNVRHAMDWARADGDDIVTDIR